jgi:hypothetical protein
MEIGLLEPLSKSDTKESRSKRFQHKDSNYSILFVERPKQGDVCEERGREKKGKGNNKATQR